MTAPVDPAQLARTRPARRPDASMTLLVEVMERPLDPGYAAAAARRARTGAPPSRPAGLALRVLLLVLVGAIAATAVISLRAPQPDAVSARDTLIAQIRSDTSAADKLQRANDSLGLANDRAQAALLRLQSQGGLADEVQELGVVAGTLPVQGPGMTVSLDDAPSAQASAGSDPRQAGSQDQGLVLDSDLQIVVNGLWAAGAEAVSINGQRLTALSAIRSAGIAILVDFRPLTPPYLVSAVGDADAMQAAFADGPSGRYLRSLSDNFGIATSIHADKTLDLPAAPGLTLYDAQTTPTERPS